MKNFRKINFFMFLIPLNGFSEIINYDSKVEVNTAGFSMIVWEAYDTETNLSYILACHSDNGQDWTLPEIISQEDSICFYPVQSIDNTGHVTAAWLVNDTQSNELILFAAMYNFNLNQWLTYEQIDFVADLRFSLKVNSEGRSILTYSATEGESFVIKATSALAGTSGWTPPLKVSF